jgi:hypothetical protein
MMGAAQTWSADEDSGPVAGVIEPLARLSRDLQAAAARLAPGEVRWLVQLYYELQEQRIRTAAQMREATGAAEPNALVAWLLGNYATLENDVRRAMNVYSVSRPEGRWLRSVVGIGPVLAAGLLAHIDITRAPSASHLWSFAGLNPTVTWGKGQKRPWNAKLKVLCWKCGESFVKTAHHPRSFYGPIYEQRKAREQTLNEQGAFAEQAAAALKSKRFRPETEAYAWYARGKLPPAHIHARAERYTVKLFLAHVHAVFYEVRYGQSAPRPYAIEHGGHVDVIAPPNWPLACPSV